VTKLDVLSMFERIPVCTAYKLEDGSETIEFPAHQTDFHHAQPVYEELPGWSADISGITAFAELPEAARAYLDFVEERVGVPVTMVGIGQRRDQTLTRRELAPAA
jgi:adenylosuccinate synthase